MELKEFLEKISSYNIFNHLLPGTVFCVIGSHISNINFLQNDLLSGFFIYYLVGVIISRIGSIIIEPIFKTTNFVIFAPYDKYIEASRIDPKIDVLSETNNMYRTLTSLFICLLALKLYMFSYNHYPWISEYKELTILLIFLLMFSLAYRKQTKYIKSRIEKSSQ
ncbi:hypothetical protein [Aeromonas enteropelogenes]|uniref:hypothetical protein n=1 Tax=Aeromonas enteropelogenes TaxID=29489 RepID=UPI003F747312